ncbi:MAG: hypothetical protein M1814_006179 [Vezdaea aestivalis]|nr:MAG: hypothetical protein M1814_006179 [Vezdaea aestivalis]
MFGLIADLLCSLLTLLLPIYATHRALRTPTPASTTPWLTYWLIHALLLFLESWTSWLLSYFPFYSWIRLGLHIWLVLPQTQGAQQLYTTYVSPFLSRHESDIERAIGNAHDHIKAFGWASLRSIIDAVRVHVLRLEPTRRTPDVKPPGGYAQSLLARFNLPGAAPAGGDVYGLFAAALGQLSAVGGGISRGEAGNEAAEGLSASGMLIPPGIRGKDDKREYIAAQREKLGVLMRALDREAVSLETEGDELGRSRSEVSFDRVERDEVGEGDDGSITPGAQKRTASGGWISWGWGAGEKGSSTGVDLQK